MTINRVLRLAFIASFCATSLLLSGNSFAQKTISWLKTDFPPYYILSGKQQGMGRDESIISLLEKELPEYQFERIEMPGGRVIKELTNPYKSYCMLSLYKTPERESAVLFTKGFSTLGLPISLVLRKTLAAELGVEGEKNVSLRQLFSHPSLRLGVSAKRSYGNDVDEIIANLPEQQKFYRSGQDVLSSLLYMLKLGRVDAALGYPAEHLYLARKHEIDGQLSIFQIEENTQFSQGFIGCTNNLHGYENIKVLEQALSRIKQKPEYQEALMRWVPLDLQANLLKKLNSTLK